jgi:hypothetical protein
LLSAISGKAGARSGTIASRNPEGPQAPKRRKTRKAGLTYSPVVRRFWPFIFQPYIRVIFLQFPA